MKATWAETTLGAICDAGSGEIKTGPFGSQLHKSDYIDVGVPVVMPTNIEEGRISTSGIARISNENVTRLSKHKLTPGDIVYGRRGDIGRQALITDNEDGWLCGTGCLRISLGDGPIDPTFLHYYLRDESVINYISNQAVGATMPNLNTKILRSIPIQHPDLPTQKKIAGILSAYDDLIENNLRRIKILEGMAQSLYREWFVHFRIPAEVLTKAGLSPEIKFVDSPMGKIPEGWEVKKLGEVAEVNAESIRQNNAPGSINYIDIKSVSTGSVDEVKPMAFADAPSRARRIVRNGDVIWSTVRPNRRSFALILDPIENLIASTGFAVLSAKQVPFSYLFYATTTEDFTGYLVNHATGAAYPAVNTGIFEQAPLLIPSSELLEQFNSSAEPMLRLAHTLQRRNENLRKTRDLLLPKLLSVN